MHIDMEVNSKRNDSHHMPCLSGLSQAPLIGENGSERLTPISAHSLSHQSPNRIQLCQTSTPLEGTPQIPSFSCPTSSVLPPAKPSIFFPAPVSKMNHQDRVTQASESNINVNNESHKTFDLNMNVEHELNREDSRLFGQDENYHLYHEPLDLDDEPATVSVHSTFQRRPPASINIISSYTLDTNNQQISHPPPTPRSSVGPMTTPREWLADPQHLPPRPSSQSQMISHQRSPLYARQDDRDTSESGTRTTPAPFSDRATSFRNDVADDVYFRYVTLKSAAGTNHRSRSYHGPKNLSGPNAARLQDDQTLLTNIENLNKNLSSTSISELPTSPVAATIAQTPAPLRDHCIRELLETERNYVCALEMIITCFAKPLEILLKRDDNQLIFGHIRNFYHIHSIFQNDLIKATYKLFNRELPLLPLPTRENIEQAASNPATPTLAGNKQFFGASPLSSPTTRDVTQRAPKISTSFLNMKEKFLKYGEYCATLSRAQGLIDELTSKNEAIAAQLDRCQQEANEGKFKLRDLLSLPMQRILKYHLLLGQLIKNTSPSSDDYQGLKRAHEAMVDLGQYINEVKRDTEATQIMNEIEQSIVGLNMPPNTRLIDYGRLVTDGFINIRPPQELRSKSAHELSKIKLPQDTKLKQKRYVFVFDKVILMCKLSNVRRYQYKEALVLSEYELNLNPSVSNDLLNKHTIKDKWNYAFELYRPCDRTAYTFLPKTVDMKNKWVNAIQRAMDNTRPTACRSGNNLGHEFLMHTFEKASSCDQCGKLLLGLYYQGYRCRICFSSVHKKCLGSVRACGPALPPKSSATLAHPSHRSRCNEPQSPLVGPNTVHSNNGHDVLMHFPSSNSLSNQGVDAQTKNELNNNNNMSKGQTDGVASSSFRENGARATPAGQRPVSSMINVSLQNSTNQMIQQNRLLRNSTSTPSISRQASPRVKAIQNFYGNAECNEMEIIAGDVILLGSDPEKNDVHMTRDAMDTLMSKLNLSSDFNLSEVSWLFGRNLRTGSEGRFPSLVVEQQESEMAQQRILGDEDFRPNSAQPINSYINFPLSDQPWFNDRMDRDRAQALLEERPHGTFLVRVSLKHHNSHVISLKYHAKVMHMRIYVSKDNQLYLSQNRYFNSLVELVSWYQENSLVESFNMLDAKLLSHSNYIRFEFVGSDYKGL